MIPWPVVSLIGAVARLFGFQTYVRAAGGPGWYMGRIGAERVYFIRHPADEPWPKVLKVRRS